MSDPTPGDGLPVTPDPEGAGTEVQAAAASGGVDLAAFLLARGVDEERVARAEDEGHDALRRLALAVTLLGEPLHLRPPEVWGATRASEDLSRRLWRAMGFADLPEDSESLTAADTEALRAIADYLAATGVGEELAVRFTRLLGQTMGRVADALLSIVDQGLDQLVDLPDGDDDDLVVLAAELVTPLIERELTYLLRRHLHAGATRRTARATQDQEQAVVGFADVVSFTRLSGQLPEEDLAELVESFEATTTEIIADRGGRVVKLIGDAVLFTLGTDEAAEAGHLALDLVDAFGGDRPELRVGMAAGPVLSRLGDVFGPTVNLASRLVGWARPGTVLVDGALAELVEGSDDPVLRTRSLRPRDLKGLGTTPLHVLRR